MCSFTLFQLTDVFQLRELESNITYVKVDSHALNWNKLVNWNKMEEHIQFQLGELK